MLKRVFVPNHLQKGIGRNHKGIEGGWNVGAFDTETVRGVPDTLQFSFDGKDAIVHRVRVDTIFSVFVQQVELWAKRQWVNVLFAHNLKFDLQGILYAPEHRSFFGLERRDFILPIARVDGLPPLSVVEADRDLTPDQVYASYLHCFTDKTWFARMKLRDHRRVHLVDSNAFFKMSLAEAAKMVGSPVQKLDRPEGLGERSLAGREDFEAYVREDAKAQWFVGEAIYRLHQEHDVRLSVSLPQLAARILRHRFFREEDRIEFPPAPIVRAMELSYHGGKNQMKRNPDGTWASGYYDNVWEIDINSAYTAAMTRLPSMLKGTWKNVDVFVPGSHGVYLVSGHVRCPYGCVFTHDFRRVEGTFDDIWMTSYELESGLAAGCLETRRVRGHIWIAKSRYSPLKAFAEHFWDEKARWTEIEGKRGFHTLMSKLYPNSTYGKLISTIYDPDLSEVTVDESMVVESEDVYRACGIYNPAIATFITGMVRGFFLHTQEHAFDSIHSSTDSIKTLKDPTGSPIIGKALGQWSVEIHGPCCLIRPKLYIHESVDEFVRDREGRVRTDEHGRPLKTMKVARHGFRGQVRELLEAADWTGGGKRSPVLQGRAFNYMATKVWTARESLIRTGKSVVPLNFDRVPVSLKSIIGTGPVVVKNGVELRPGDPDYAS